MVNWSNDTTSKYTEHFLPLVLDKGLKLIDIVDILRKCHEKLLITKRPRCFDQFWSAWPIDRIVPRSQVLSKIGKIISLIIMHYISQMHV